MKINELSKENKKGNREPSELVARYVMAVEDSNLDVGDFLQQFDFETEDEMKAAVSNLVSAIVCDEYMRDKNLQTISPERYAIFVRAKKIYHDPSRLASYPGSVTGKAWVRYSRNKMSERCAMLWGETVKPDKKKFAETCDSIKRIYQLTDSDIDKIRFFVEQVKAGKNFPNSLRRMLYIWGNAKKTGKTTSATMLVSVLNGDEDENNISLYSSRLSDEMQIGSFKVPRIAQCNCVLMDECFFADMKKVYADFKRFMTSSDGRARLPYGQEFTWYGRPNYIATSNDSLDQFIKDWDDRRFCSVEFKSQPTVKLDFRDIKELWKNFIVNSTPADIWQRWSDKLMDTAEEIGSRTVAKAEYELYLKQSAFRSFIFDRPAGSKWSNENRITLKHIINFFGEQEGMMQAANHRDEIKRAMITVFGETARDRSGKQTNFWLVDEIKGKLDELKNNEIMDIIEDRENNEKLPF